MCKKGPPLFTRRSSGKSGRLPAHSQTRSSGLSAADQSQDSDLETCDVSRDNMAVSTADSVQVNICIVTELPHDFGELT